MIRIHGEHKLLYGLMVIYNVFDGRMFQIVVFPFY